MPSLIGKPPPIELADVPDRGSRPWTAELAMEPLPPLSPADAVGRETVVLEAPPRSKLMTATVVIAAAAAIFVMVASHLDLAHTQAPSFAVNEITATGPAGGALLAPGHFPTTAREIDVEASYVGAVAGDALTLQVTFGSTTFPPRTAALAPGTGTVGAAVFPVGNAFQPGVYTVNALFQGMTVRSDQFTVDPAATTPIPGR